jgi:hypothetical protein
MKSTAIGIQFDVNDLDANYEVLGSSDNYSFQYKLGKGSDLVGFEGETAQRVISLEGNYGEFDVRIFAVSDIGIRSDFIEGTLIVNPPEFNGTFTFATLEVTNAREDPALTSEIIEAPTGVGDDLVVFSQYPGKNINLAWSLSPPPGHALEGKVVTSELLNDTFFDHFSISIKTGENGVVVSDTNLSNSTSLQGYLRTSNVTGELNNYRNFNFNLTPQIFNDDNLNFGREVSFEIVAHDINGNTSTGILSGINFAPEPESVAYSLNGINAAFSWDINTADFVAININTLAIPSSQTLEYPEDLQSSREYLQECEDAINWSNVPNIEYASGEKVEYQGLLYKCIQDHTTTSSQKLPTNTTYWTEIGEYYQFQYNEYTSFEQSIEIPQVWGYSYYYTFQAVDDFGPGEVFNLTEGGAVDSTDTGEFRELYALSPEINISNLRYRERKDDLVFDWDILDQDGNVVDLEQYRVAFTSNDIPSVLGISGHLYNNDTDLFLTGITEGDKSRTKTIDEQGNEFVAYGLPTTKVFDHFEFTRNLNNEIFKSRGYPEGWEYFKDTGVYSYGDFVIGGDGFLYNVVDGIPVIGDNDVPPDDQYHGYPGSFAVDDNYYYLCVAANTWRRIGAATVTRTSSYLGDTDFDDDYFYICKQTTSWLKIPLADADLSKEAVVGEIDYDLNYLYVNTNDGWKRHALTKWNGTNVGGGQGDSAYVKPSYESWNPSETYYNNSSAPWADVFEYNDELYVTNQTFGPTSTSVRGLFNYNTIYSLGDIVIAPTDSRIRQYDSNNNYAIGDIVLYSNGIYQNLVYQSSADVVAPGTNRRRWKLLSPFFDIECAYYESPGSSINSIPAVENWPIKTPENLSFFDLYASGYQYPDLRNWNNQDEFNTGSLVVYNNDIWSGVGASGPDTDAGAVTPSTSAFASNYWANNIGGVDFFSENQPGDKIYHNEAVYQCLDFNPTGAPIIASTTSPQEINSDYINSQWMPFWELNDEYNDFVFGHVGINESGKRSVGLEVGIISSDGEVLDVQKIVGRNPEPSILDAGFKVDSLSEAGKVKFDFNYAFGLREKTTKVHLYRSSERQFDITGSDGLALSNVEEGGSLVKVLLGAGDATFGDNITEIVDTPPIPVENGDEQITGYYYKILPFDDFGSGDLYSINNKVLVYPKNFNTQDPSAPAGPVIRTTSDDIPGPVVNFEGRTAFENFFLSWQIPGSENTNLLKNIPNDLSHYEVWSGKSDHLYFDSLNVALTQETNKDGFRRIFGDLQSLGNIPLEQLDPAEGITNAVNIFNVAANGNSTQVSREGISNEEAYFWVRAVDKAGNKSPFTGKADLEGDNVEGLRLQLGQMDVTDIDGFELSLTDSFPNTIALEPNNPFKNNTPIESQVSWDTHTLFHNGNYYEISGSNAGSGYIWWNSGDSQYSFSEIHPAGSDGTDGVAGFDDGDFIIARSRGGIATPVFHVFANALIGTANIADAAIISAKINDLTADKITAGTIGAEDIQIGNEGNIRSNGFQGLSDTGKGFVVSGDGSFVFAADDGRLYFDNDELVLEGKLRQVDGSEYTFINLSAEPSYFYYSEDVNGDLNPDSQEAIDIYARYQNSDISAEDVRFRMTTANGQSVFTYDEFENRVDNSISGFTYDPTDGFQDFSDQDIKIAHAEFECQISSPSSINPGFDNIYDTYSESAVILYASGVGASIETSTTISLISDGAPGDNGSSVNLKFTTTPTNTAPSYDDNWKNDPPGEGGFLWAIKITTDKDGNETEGEVFRVDADAIAEVYIYKQGTLDVTETPSTDTTYDFSNHGSNTSPLSIHGDDINSGWTSSPVGLDSSDEISVLVGVAYGYKNQEDATINWLTPGVVFSKKGDKGEEGRSPTFRGKYSEGENYYAVDPVAANNQPGRGDIVYHEGTLKYYIAIQDSGPDTSIASAQIPSSTSDYWKEFGAEFSSVATELLLTKEAFVQQKLTLGEGGNQLTAAKDGIIVSAKFKGGLYNTEDGPPAVITQGNEDYSTAGFLLARTKEESVYFDIGAKIANGLNSYLRFDSSTKQLQLNAVDFNGTLLTDSSAVGSVSIDWSAFLAVNNNLKATFIAGGFANTIHNEWNQDKEYNVDDVVYVSEADWQPYEYTCRVVHSGQKPSASSTTTYWTRSPITYKGLASAIIGGGENKIEGRFSFIGAGYKNECDDNFSAIAAGYKNSMPDNDKENEGANFIGAGQVNKIEGGSNQVILGGTFNKIIHDSDENPITIKRIYGEEIKSVVSDSGYFLSGYFFGKGEEWSQYKTYNENDIVYVSETDWGEDDNGYWAAHLYTCRVVHSGQKPFKNDNSEFWNRTVKGAAYIGLEGSSGGIWIENTWFSTAAYLSPNASTSSNITSQMTRGDFPAFNEVGWAFAQNFLKTSVSGWVFIIFNSSSAQEGSMWFHPPFQGEEWSQDKKYNVGDIVYVSEVDWHPYKYTCRVVHSGQKPSASSTTTYWTRGTSSTNINGWNWTNSTTMQAKNNNEDVVGQWFYNLTRDQFGFCRTADNKVLFYNKNTSIYQDVGILTL